MIFHILKRAEWEAALAQAAHGRLTYSPPSLASEGFIHCSTWEQVPSSGKRFFAGQADLAVLCIDPLLLTAPVKMEAGFPHIYGSLNLNAVVEVVDFPCLPDGSFGGLPHHLNQT